MYPSSLSRARRPKFGTHRCRLIVEQLEDRCLLSAGYRTIDGTGNNLLHADWGAAGIDLLRRAPAAYGDGISTLGGANRPSPRLISDVIDAQGTASILNNRDMSDWIWQWGQFIDHDLDLTPTDPSSPDNIPVPTGDPFFDPQGTGTQVIGFNRSVYDPATGTGAGNPRQQPNVLTAYIDGSQVYGSDPVRASALRTFVGGKLKTSPGDLLPLNNSTYFTTPLSNANNGPFPNSQLYAAGDVRANEQIGLTAVHTLFMREHNRVAGVLAQLHPSWNDETLYQEARRIVGAEIEAITYNEFLPALLGPYAPSIFGAYNPNVNASVTTEFSTAAFRVGHTLLSPQILRIENNGTSDPRGSISLADSFFNPPLLTNSTDLDEILKGLASQNAQEIDNKLVDGVRNFLFGPPGAGGFDLASLNIQRGRDHGLSDYNTVREAYGLPRVHSFAQITSNVTVQKELRSLYGKVDNIDLWVGALAEDHLAGASTGPTITAILVDEFSRAETGDRFFFTHDPAFTPDQVESLAETTLADVIRRNTGITNLQENVFLFGVPEDDGAPDAERLPTLPVPAAAGDSIASLGGLMIGALARASVPVASPNPLGVSEPGALDSRPNTTTIFPPGFSLADHSVDLSGGAQQANDSAPANYLFNLQDVFA
jgi:hypothetical protein